MDKQELHDKLKDLHSELQRVKTLDDKERSTLEGLARDIQAVLEKGHDEKHNYSSLAERLKNAVAELEVSHPKATLTMRELIDQMAFMGI